MTPTRRTGAYRRAASAKYDAAPPSTSWRVSNGVWTSSYAREPTTRMCGDTETGMLVARGRRVGEQDRDEVHGGGGDREPIGLEDAFVDRIARTGAPVVVERALAIHD